MEKPLQFRQLFMPNPNPDNLYPNYQNKLQPRMDFNPVALEQLYIKHKDSLMETVIIECARYLDDEAWMEEGTFPRVQELTGDWYLGSVYMSERKDKIRLSLDARFLGHYPKGCAKKEIDDYLDMEAWFDYDPAQDAFIFDCFDTDAI